MITERTYSGPRVERYHPHGAGMVRPFLRVSHGDFASDQGAATIMSNLGQVLGTQRGVLPWRPEFGSQLHRVRHQRNTGALRELAAVYVKEACSLWEPRVTLRRVTVEAAPENQIHIRAAIRIDGESADQVLHFRRAVDWASSETVRGWNIANSGRSLHGMQHLQAPKPAAASPPPAIAEGLVRPIRRGARDFLYAGGADAIRSNVGQLFGTQKGVLPWRPEFGSDLHRLRHKGNTPTVRELARLYVDEALTRWEPRVKATKVALLPLTAATANVVDILIETAVGAVSVTVK